ncbi:MAG: extracellular solute-binding protein, partial [Anaerolineae bacterium]|nr:extracellular solute-binding protein [Anaerolineae bacterium]
MVKNVTAVACLTILLSLSGCGPFAVPTTPPPLVPTTPSPRPVPATPSPQPPVPTATAVTLTAETPTTTPITPTLPTVPPVITLTLWTAEPFSPAQADASGQILGQQIEAFTADHPDVVVEYVLKKPYGKGGILNFLLTTSEAVPAAMPDLVAIDTIELKEAAQAGLLQPLDELISAELQEDLFPFAQQVGRFEDQLVGLPFETDIEHLIYNTNKLEEPPLTWTDVLTDEVSYVFPAGGREGLVNDAFIIQYLALGGQLVDETGQPALNAESVTQVLQFYKDGYEMGVIPSSVLEFKTLDDCWPVYLSAEVAMTNVSSRRYLADRELLMYTRFAPIPTRDGNVATLSQGWAWAIVTSDPTRQALAVQLIEWLMEPENSVEWNLAAGHLPTRKAAFEVLG